jgi:hypothetical protein
MTSSYTQCACRDCMDNCTTAQQGGWTLCGECLTAGCTPCPPAQGEWPGRRPEGDYECQRDDAHGDAYGQDQCEGCGWETRNCACGR